MLDEKDLQAIAALIKEATDPIKTQLTEMNEKLEQLDEAAEITRDGVNSLLDWAEQCGNVIKFPLPKVK